MRKMQFTPYKKKILIKFPWKLLFTDRKTSFYFYMRINIFIYNIFRKIKKDYEYVDDIEPLFNSFLPKHTSSSAPSHSYV